MGPVSIPILFANDEYEIRPARSLDEFRDLWWSFMQNLGWNRGYYDLESITNPSIGYGMILLIERATQKPIGHVSAAINSNSTGWISMFVIDEAHRAKGMGRELFKAAMADFERCGTSIRGLDGVPQQKKTYERRGFVESPIGFIKPLSRSLVTAKPLPVRTVKGSMVDLRKVPQKLLVQHELKYTGFERPRLWNDDNMFNRPDVVGVALVEKNDIQSVDDIRGWAMLRRCSDGVRLGPLYASDTASAEAILTSILNLATPKYIKSVPLPNAAMNDWSEEEIANKATVCVEVWSGNPEAESLFGRMGWESSTAGYDKAYHMWVDGKATPQQSGGGLAQQGLFAVFDAAVG